MSDLDADPPELERAINELRQIYWREYGRGWRAAIQSIKDILARPPSDPDAPPALLASHQDREKA